MFDLSARGPNWRKVRGILKNYNRRIDFVRARSGELIAKAFLSEIKRLAPGDRAYQNYIDSLQVVRLSGGDRSVVFAVITGDMREPIGDVLSDPDRKSNTVVYVGVSESSVPEDGAILMSQNNPWPVNMLPLSLPEGVTLVHRIVSDNEMEWAIDNTKDFIMRTGSDMKALGLFFGDLEFSKTAGTDSMPDNITLALRAEFGVNTDAKPHWRPALGFIRKHLKKILLRDGPINRALGDWLFRGHLLAKSDGDGTIKQFNDRYGDFQEKVIRHG